ncbi:unnamed protein product [Nezara viridula]|uniref:Neuropeptide n=1 Tax=Nezara viridula TaxID=85310 RepID=A0A9P0H8I0_NEZVI|nr:unnamed protein product [Nezara viridula]
MPPYLLIVSVLVCLHLMLGVAEGSESSHHDPKLSMYNIIANSVGPRKPAPMGYARCIANPARCCPIGVPCCHGDMYCCHNHDVFFGSFC